MTNKEIARVFQYLGDIMELHGENPFKIRSYQNAYLALRKLAEPLSEMTDEEMESIKGVGKTISAKIRELLDTGQLEAIKKYEDITPAGIREMLQVRGFGPKKVSVIWKELGAETIGELLYACNENRLIELKGFGQKTQEDLKQKLEYFQKSRGKFLYADLEAEAEKLLDQLAGKLPNARLNLTGSLRRYNNIVERIEILAGSNEPIDAAFEPELITSGSEKDGVYYGVTASELPVTIYHCNKEEFGSKLFRYSAGKEFLDAFLERTSGMDFKGLATEEDVFEKAGLSYLEPELREQAWALAMASSGQVPDLITEKDIRGVIHTHTTYSDGLNTLREMAEHARNSGYNYIGITDHSKSAFYANGLKEDRLLAQWNEIDSLNTGFASNVMADGQPFVIFKGIESDILADGSLDYGEDVLKQFDFIIASVHSNLRMDEDKATNRLVTAIENPYTRILGHPTSRLLLSRQGYPIDHQKVIDACAGNGVAIELNANPYRLDMDWTWIPYAMEKGVLISINPDAHSTAGISDIHFGVLSARKGGLTASSCLNSLNAADFQRFIQSERN